MYVPCANITLTLGFIRQFAKPQPVCKTTCWICKRLDTSCLWVFLHACESHVSNLGCKITVGLQNQAISNQSGVFVHAFMRTRVCVLEASYKNYARLRIIRQTTCCVNKHMISNLDWMIGYFVLRHMLVCVRLCVCVCVCVCVFVWAC